MATNRIYIEIPDSHYVVKKLYHYDTSIEALPKLVMYFYFMLCYVMSVGLSCNPRFRSYKSAEGVNLNLLTWKCQQRSIYLFIWEVWSVKTNMAGVRATLLAHFVRESPGTGRSLTICATNCTSRRSLWYWTRLHKNGGVSGRELAKNSGNRPHSYRRARVITQ